MARNLVHNVIRLRKGKYSKSQIYGIVVILNTKKIASYALVDKLGFFRNGEHRLFSLNYLKLSHYLNKGYKIKKSIILKIMKSMFIVLIKGISLILLNNGIVGIVVILNTKNVIKHNIISLLYIDNNVISSHTLKKNDIKGNIF